VAAASLVAASPSILPAQTGRADAPSAGRDRELKADVLIIDGSLGDVTALTNGAFHLYPLEWNIGEAAGTLAAFCLAHKLTPRQVRNTIWNSRMPTTSISVKRGG
jgi:hypothetical protein